MKYITYITGHDIEDIRVFSCAEQHKEVAMGMSLLEGKAEMLGAGFVEFKLDGSVECYGHSDSLKVDSRGEADTKILKLHMRLSRRK